MEATEILTNEGYELTEEIVMENGLGTGIKVILGAGAVVGIAAAAYKIHKHFKNKKGTDESLDDNLEEDSNATEETK